MATIYLSDGGFGISGVSVLGVWFGAVGVAGTFVEGSGALRKSRKTENGEKWPNFKTTVIANCILKCRLYFTILSFSASTFMLWWC